MMVLSCTYMMTSRLIMCCLLSASLQLYCCATVLLCAVLPCLLALADPQKPAKLQEAVADGLCALASQDWARQQLRDAGELLCCAGSCLSAGSGYAHAPPPCHGQLQALQFAVRLMVVGSSCTVAHEPC